MKSEPIIVLAKVVNVRVGHHRTEFGGEIEFENQAADSNVFSLSIVPRDRELQRARDCDPDQVRDLGDRDPAVVRPDGFHGPKKSNPDNCDVERGKWEISQAELDGRESDVSDQVDDERDRHRPRQLLAGN